MKLWMTLLTALIGVSAHAQSTSTTATTSTSETTMDEISTPATITADTATLQLKVGPGFSTVGGDLNRSTIGSTTGLNFAAEFDLPMSAGFSILTGLNYIQKGYGESATTGTGASAVSADGSAKINYLELPLLAKANFGTDTRFSLFAGPYIALKTGVSLSATRTAAGGSPTDVTFTQAQIDSVNSQVNKLDYGARFGAASELPINSGLSFVLGASYDLGLNNIDATGADNVKTRSFLANVGVGIKI